MNDDFAPFELAVKLKEKGFPQVKENTLAMYNEDGEWFSLAKNLDGFEYLFEDFDDRDCVCPTISQVLKWLREEKIYIVIAVNPTLSTKDKIAYYYQVYSNSNGVASDYYESEDCYAQWEDCAIGSIKSVLKYLI